MNKHDMNKELELNEGYYLEAIDNYLAGWIECLQVLSKYINLTDINLTENNLINKIIQDFKHELELYAGLDIENNYKTYGWGLDEHGRELLKELIEDSIKDIEERLESMK